MDGNADSFQQVLNKLRKHIAQIEVAAGSASRTIEELALRPIRQDEHIAALAREIAHLDFILHKKIMV